MPPLNKGFEYRRMIEPEAGGLPVLEYLVRHYPAFPPDEWLARIAAGRVRIDGAAARADQRLKPGQVLVWMRPPWEEPDVPASYAVLHLDGSLLAAAKPSGLPTLPGGGLFLENTLLALVRRRFPEANPLHRLGRGTSGIVLFALTKTATRKMFEAWRALKVVKEYRALVSGHPDRDDFEVDVPVGAVRHGILETVHAASPEGKPAHSRITVLERRDACSLVRARISTGRPHQIRIHLAAAGYPLAGDPLYVSGGIPAPDSRALPSDLGYHLHNTLLGFSHPETGEWTEIACMPPPVLRLRAPSTGNGKRGTGNGK
jgi:23S rRNA pseudouridine1911/1915/1917 synthase